MNKTLIKTFLLTIIFFCLISCENTIFLGEKLNLNGPVLTLIAPEARQPVNGIFAISGTINDDSGVHLISIKAEYENTDFPIQWRYIHPNNWEYSIDGVNWSIVLPEKAEDGTIIEPQFTGTATDAEWTVPVNMFLNGDNIEDGQYQFSITAWNKNNTTDENSLQVRTVILYKVPPSVRIITPFTYARSTIENPASPVSDLLNKSGNEYRNPAYLGKYVNSSFDLQWQITEKNEVWSIDIRFYKLLDDSNNILEAEDFDDNNNRYIFRANINADKTRPLVPDPSDVVRPNGIMTVPDLTNAKKDTYHNIDADYKVDYEVLNPLTANNKPHPLQIIVRCYNAAGFPVENRVAGTFMYWPESDVPWIEFPGDMLKEFDLPASPPDISHYTVFPDRNVPSKGYDDDGIDRIEYTIIKLDASGNPDNSNILSTVYPKIIIDEDNNKNLSWAFEPPKEYVGQIFQITAKVYDINGNFSESTGYFKTTDISMPEIYAPTTPVAIDPLYQYIVGANEDEWNFDIRGFATDSKTIESIYMVWINPKSANYSAMSQLAFFRDPDYNGWTGAAEYYNNNPAATTPYLDGSYEPADDTKKNKVWKLSTTNAGLDPETRRYRFDYFINLKLKNDLNIAPSAGDPFDYLKSQVFLFKASNGTDEESQSAIIVWSPQGANIAPELEITKVEIYRYNTTTGLYPINGETLEIGSLDEIDYINVKDRIEITGTWKEDSAKFLSYNRVLRPYFDVTLGTTGVIPKDQNSLTGWPHTEFTINETSPNAGDGLWTVKAIVGDADDTSTHALRIGNIRDTLMINAKTTNIGGQSSEYTATWFVKSDFVRFLKLGAEPDIRDGEFREGAEIEFYFEFNKPVKLKTIAGNPTVRLYLNSGGYADYFDKTGTNTPSTKQYFKYIVGAADSTLTQLPDKLLNINSLDNNGQESSSDTYPFSWVTENGEEIRMVIGEGAISYESYRTNVIPTGTSNAALKTVKQIIIDNTPPVMIGEIKISGRGSWYGENNTIYLTADFDEPINIGLASDEPKLVLNIKNPNGEITQRETEKVIRNTGSLIFSYKIDKDDYTLNGEALIIQSITGIITDIAGNPYNTGSYINRTPTDASNNPAKVWAIIPDVPTVQILNTTADSAGDAGTSSGTWNPGLYDDSEEFVNLAPGDGISIINLKNYYAEELWVKLIQAPPKYGIALPAEAGFSNLEWSVNYGRDWKTIAEGEHKQTVVRSYDITARQTDKAGNISTWSKPISLVWDRGDLLTEISTESTGGTYTYIDSETPTHIDIDLTFRRPVKFTSSWSIRLNVQDRISPQTYTYKDITLPANTTAESKFKFRYTVADRDTTNENRLTVTLVPGFSATDEFDNNVTTMINTDLANSTDRNIHLQKAIIIQTGKPELLTGPVFTPGLIADDDTLPGTVTFTFDKPIVAGAGNIKIIQQAAGYRLPGVLTKSQYDRYAYITNLSKYYKPGTHGYNGTAADTTPKYILDFNVDTYSNRYLTDSTTTGEGTEDTDKTAELTALAAALREAESITLPALSSFVKVLGTSLTVNLSFTNSLKVPGAVYEISYPTGFIQDERIGNPCEALTASTFRASTTGGRPLVSRPYIRVNKPQEKISERTGTTALPKYYLTQEERERINTVQIRMDNRTPDSRVRYASTIIADDINMATMNTNNQINWSWSKGAALPVRGADPADPATPTGTSNDLFQTDGRIIITGDNYPLQTIGGLILSNGYKYRVRAVGTVQNAGIWITAQNADFALPSANQVYYREEVLYRTVITFKGINTDTTISDIQMNEGDSLWVRGGNTMTSTTIPGYPLTPEDNFAQVKSDNERAGIRLMTRVNNDTTTLLRNSAWQYVTWDINATAYITIFLGRDTETGMSGTENISVVNQYGPRYFASQTGNWSLLKEYYCIFPGQHRWLNSVLHNATAGSGRIEPFTFLQSFNNRTAYTEDDVTFNAY